MLINKRNNNFPPRGEISSIASNKIKSHWNKWNFFLITLNSFIEIFFFEYDTQTNPVIYFLQLEVSEELETFSLLKIL